MDFYLLNQCYAFVIRLIFIILNYYTNLFFMLIIFEVVDSFIVMILSMIGTVVFGLLMWLKFILCFINFF